MPQAHEVVARETLFGKRVGEDRFPITIEIGRPFKWGGTSPTEWACALKVEPFHSHATHGEGSLQALCLALQLVRSELNNFTEQGGSLVWEDGQKWELESYWPLEPY
jgi:hypothetical protein